MVYLIHFDSKLSHARHYIGFATDKRNLTLRMEHHRNGSGARIMQVVTERGIPWSVVRTWEKGDRSFERKLKRRKDSDQLCPICNPSNWQRNAPEPIDIISK